MSKLRSGLFGAVILLGVAGCATLEVKVDVYKGPLASHDEVIAQRVAASTIGMQSDLLRLRQEITLKSKDTLEPFCAYVTKQNVNPKKDSNFDYTPYADVSPNDLMLACEIDALLNLFEPSADADPVLLDFKSTASILQGTAENGLARFDRSIAHPNDRRARDLSARLWSIWRSAPNSKKGRLALTYSCFLDNGDGQKVDCQFGEWVPSSYRVWEPIFVCAADADGLNNITPSGPDGDLVLGAANSVIASLSSEPVRNQSVAGGPTEGTCLDYGYDGYDELDREIGSNAGFSALSDRKIVAAHAAALLSNPSERAAFIDEVTSVAAAFVNIRDAQSDYLREGLVFLRRYAQSGTDEPTVSGAVSSSVADVISYLIHPRYIANAICLTKQSGTPANYYRFLPSLARVSDPCEVYFSSTDLINIRSDIRTSLIEHPIEASRFFLHLDAVYRETTYNDVLRSGVAALYARPEKRRFGITAGPPLQDASISKKRRGPPSNPRAQQLPLWSQESWRAFLDALNSADEQMTSLSAIDGHARLPEGLWSLVEDFVNASDQATIRASSATCQSDSDCDLRSKDAARKRLVGELVRFSEKTLALANSAHEFEIYRDSAFFGETVIYRTALSRELYAIVLQRIGNTAMAIVDDMYASTDYDARQLQNAPSELLAIKQTFGSDVSGSFERIRESIAAQVENEEGEKSATIDALKDLKTKAAQAEASKKSAVKQCSDHGIELAQLLLAMDRPKSAPTLTFCPSADGTVSTASAYAIKRAEALWKTPYEVTKSTFGQSSNATLYAETANAQPADGKTTIDAYLDAILAKLRAAKVSDTDDAEAFAAAQVVLISVMSDEAVKTGVKERLSGTVLPSGAQSSVVYIAERGIVPEMDFRLAAYSRHQSLVAGIPTVQTAVARAEQAVVKANQDVTAKQAEVDSQSTASSVPRAALEFTDAMRTDVLSVLRSIPPEHVTPQMVKDTIAAQIRARGKTAHPAADFVDSLSTPQDVPSAVESIISANAKSTAKDVLDGLITALRYEQIRAIREHGKDSNAAKYAQEALDAAYRQRSDQIYLRPAISYLRTSFASSALGDNAIRWRNRLGEQVIRSIPVVGRLIENDFIRTPFNNNSKEKLQILEANDTQFWQNVNNVRVSGTGETNYVVTKDDIGNWYVRGYETNPSVIADSMSNLALFNVGAPSGILLDDDSGQARTAITNPLEQAYDNRLTAFDRNTDQFYTTLQSRLAAPADSNEIVSAVRSAWSSNDQLKTPRSATEGATEVAPSALLEPLAVSNADVLLEASRNMAAEISAVDEAFENNADPKRALAMREAKSRAIIMGLRSYRTYQFRVASGVNNLQGLRPATEGSASEKETALSVLSSTLGAMQETGIEARESDMNDLRSMSGILASSVSGQ